MRQEVILKHYPQPRPYPGFFLSAFQREDGPKRLHVHLFLGGEGALGQLDFLKVHCERFEGQQY